jgi:hypothetical protein
VAYALVVYPLIGYAAGQRYPATPTFGLPCPTVIFTFGVLLWATPRIPLRLLVIPALWAMLGISAASAYGITQGYGLPAAAVIACGVALWSKSRLEAPRRKHSEGLNVWGPTCGRRAASPSPGNDAVAQGEALPPVVGARAGTRAGRGQGPMTGTSDQRRAS